jgi:hypothetical protein
VYAGKRLGKHMAVGATTRTVGVSSYTGSGFPLRAGGSGAVSARQVGAPTRAGVQQSLCIQEGHVASVRRFRVCEVGIPAGPMPRYPARKHHIRVSSCASVRPRQTPIVLAPQVYIIAPACGKDNRPTRLFSTAGRFLGGPLNCGLPLRQSTVPSRNDLALWGRRALPGPSPRRQS